MLVKILVAPAIAGVVALGIAVQLDPEIIGYKPILIDQGALFALIDGHYPTPDDANPFNSVFPLLWDDKDGATGGESFPVENKIDVDDPEWEGHLTIVGSDGLTPAFGSCRDFTDAVAFHRRPFSYKLGSLILSDETAFGAKIAPGTIIVGFDHNEQTRYGHIGVFGMPDTARQGAPVPCFWMWDQNGFGPGTIAFTKNCLNNGLIDGNVFDPAEYRVLLVKFD